MQNLRKEDDGIDCVMIDQRCEDNDLKEHVFITIIKVWIPCSSLMPEGEIIVGC